MNVNVFDLFYQQNKKIFEHKNHSEFVIGIDFNLFEEKIIASTGYDGTLRVWKWD